ncbi:hypothetical protein D5086_032986, partial [Populus alba]
MSFAYQLLYLLDATGFYSLGLHALGIHVLSSHRARAGRWTLLLEFQKIRSNERAETSWPPMVEDVMLFFVVVVSNASNAQFSSPSQSTLPVILYSCRFLRPPIAEQCFLFKKMMEWWYQSAEEGMSAPTVYPPPPPPPAPKVRKELFSLGFHDGFCTGFVKEESAVHATVGRT